jgi:hypothetical protein
VSIQDEGQLKVRLGSALDEIEPGPAPLAAVVRQGTGIRRRRQAAVAGGVAVVAAAAVLGPTVLRSELSAPPVAPAQHYNVTVSPPAQGAKPGEIATGSINGWHWQATLSGTGDKVGVIFGTDFISIGSVSGALAAGDFAAFDSTEGDASRYAYVAPVATAVRYLTVRLADTETLTLWPQSWKGQRYVAMVLPGKLRVRWAAAYGAHGELGYAIPFNFGESATFQSWLRPGQTGLPKATVRIGSGGTGRYRWTATAYVGPWGLCERVLEPGGGIDGSCQPVGTRLSEVVTGSFGGSVGTPEIGELRDDAGALVLTRSDGSQTVVDAVHVPGIPYGLVAMIRPPQSGIRSWFALDAKDDHLGSGRGDPLDLP